MSNRAPDWLRQAPADIEHAKAAMEGGDFEWSCFAAQQGAEKALKALFYQLHGDAWGHSFLSLMQSLPDSAKGAVSAELLDSARALDKHYIPTRYPDGFSEGAPTDYYTKRDAEDSLSHAQSIFSFCEDQIRRSPGSTESGEADSEENRGEPS